MSWTANLPKIKPAKICTIIHSLIPETDDSWYHATNSLWICFWRGKQDSFGTENLSYSINDLFVMEGNRFFPGEMT